VDYSKHFSSTATPQTEPLPGKDQVKNSAGGFVFKIDEFSQLSRFITLGTENGTYYATERDITRENCKNVIAAIKKDGIRVVSEVLEISSSGRAPKNDPALFVLAMCTNPDFADEKTRNFAFECLPKIARTPTHLFHFTKYMLSFRGWGRAAKRGIANYYLATPIDKLAMHMVKYQQRDGWSHADLLRTTHPKTADETRNALFKYAVDGVEPPIAIVKAAETLKSEKDNKKVVSIIKEHKLPMEAVPTDQRTPEVYEAVLETNGLEWLFRNLGNLTKHGLIGEGKFDFNDKVMARLTDKEQLKKQRLHPLKVLMALLQYRSGGGFKSSSTWTANKDIIDCLNDAFYASFGNVTPTDKRILWGCDVSGSMGMGCVGGVQGLTPAMAQAALLMVTYQVEKRFIPMAFSSQFVQLDISRAKRLDDVMKYMYGHGFGGTDCSLPMRYALEKGLEIDSFIVSTDNETWAGNQHPVEALKEYRRKTGIPAKLAVIGMTSTGFSIADPNDAGMMDFVGFDAAGPELLSGFIREGF
jgi:60 kDa SS-A/Ro ribonucleoprotein